MNHTKGEWKVANFSKISVPFDERLDVLAEDNSIIAEIEERPTKTERQANARLIAAAPALLAACEAIQTARDEHRKSRKPPTRELMDSLDEKLDTAIDQAEKE